MPKFGEILVPGGVISEVLLKFDNVSKDIVNATKSWLKIRDVTDNDTLKILIDELNGAEAEVIHAALEENIEWVILDDQKARKTAHKYGLNVIGILGFLAWAKKEGYITSFFAEIEALRKQGFYASFRLIKMLLDEVGE